MKSKFILFILYVFLFTNVSNAQELKLTQEQQQLISTIQYTSTCVASGNIALHYADIYQIMASNLKENNTADLVRKPVVDLLTDLAIIEKQLIKSLNDTGLEFSTTVYRETTSKIQNSGLITSASNDTNGFIAGLFKILTKCRKFTVTTFTPG